MNFFQRFLVNEPVDKVLIGISSALLLLIEAGGIILLALTGFMDEAEILGFTQGDLASLVTIQIPLILAALRGSQAITSKIATAVIVAKGGIIDPAVPGLLDPDNTEGSPTDPPVVVQP